MGPLAGLTVSTERTPRYTLGGVARALGWNTFTNKKINQNSVSDEGVLTVAAGATITSHDFDENSCLYSDNTKIGANRYPLHLLGMKLGGRNDSLNALAVTFDLKRTTWAIATRSGEFLVLGAGNGLISEKNDSGAGATADDFNGFDVVLSGGETAKALIIDEATFNVLAARVTT